MERSYRITQNDPNITKDTVFGTTWRDTFSLQIPQGMCVALKKGDPLSMKVYDSADVEYVAPDALVKVEARDGSGRNVRNIFGPANYTRVVEFQDAKKRARLDLDNPIILVPNDFLVFMTLDSTGMDTASIANSYMELMAHRIAGSIPSQGGMRAAALVEPYEINQEDGDITQADTTASVWSDLFDLKVPKGRSFILRPTDAFGAYLEDTGTTECLDTVRVKLVRRDTTNGEEKPLISETLYASIKELTDVDKLAYLELSGEVEVRQDEHIVLMGYCTVGIDKDTSYISLPCHTKRS